MQLPRLEASRPVAEKIIVEFLFLNIIKLTLPHEDFGASAVFTTFPLWASASSSSANPQEQSLHALRLPVVPHTVHVSKNNVNTS